MSLEDYLRESDIPGALEPVGKLKAQHIPRSLDGMLGALMLQGSQMGEDIEDALSGKGLQLPHGTFRVAQLCVDDPVLERLTGKERYYCRLNMYRALQEHLNSALDDTTGGFLVLMMGGLFAVLYIEEGEDYVASVCRETVNYAKSIMGFSVHVTISCPWKGTGKMESAYRTLQDLERSRGFYTNSIDRVFVIPDDALVKISDSAQRTEFEQGFYKAAERICGAVQAEDSRIVAAELAEELRRIAENSIGMPYPLTLNLNINRFMMVLQSRLVEQGLANWRHITQVDYSRRLSACGSMDEFLLAGQQIALELVAHSRELHQRKRDSLLRDIRNYVTENATDMNMGLTAVAREFRLKPREAAESFRAYYGENVNDVIHKARVKKAKELLLTTDIPVQDIAQQVGYCSLATMYRAFTNVEGVAPGKLRQSRLKDKEG